jgi:hypothetical protein
MKIGGYKTRGNLLTVQHREGVQPNHRAPTVSSAN